MFDFSINGLIMMAVITVVSYIIAVVILRSVDIDEKRVKLLLWMVISTLLTILFNLIF